jgi:hypothetical protein
MAGKYISMARGVIAMILASSTNKPKETVLLIIGSRQEAIK